MRAKLLNILTEYDKKQSTKRNYNRYALAHYCRAIDEVMEAVDGGTSIETALKVGFCGSLLRHVAKKLGLTVQYGRFE